jgi:hypothetical protein
MRLEMGCDVEDSDERYPFTIYEVRENHPFMFCALTDSHPDRFKDYDKSEVKILGKKPELQHYLRLLESLKIPTELQLGDNMIRFRAKGGDHIIVDFNLTGELLDEQSAETFIKLITQ